MSLPMAVTTWPSPTIEYGKLAPILIVLGAAVLGVLVEAFLPRRPRRPVQLAIAFVSLIAAFVAVVLLWGTRQLAAEGSVAIDGPTLFMQGTILLLALVSALLMAEKSVDPAGDAFAARASSLPGSEDERQFTQRGWLQTEVWPLFLFSVAGMLMFPASNDLLLMFIALEVMSLPLYLMAGMARRRRLLSQEAALKYFILGAFSSAFFLYGTALLYGYSSTIDLGLIGEAMAAKPGETGLLMAGVAMLAVGMLFKVAAVPFHQWTPDVYQGSPTPVTGFMAAAVKVAAFGALLRVFYVAFGGIRFDWEPMVWVVAALTMLVGSVVAITQSDVKRMLAYSSIAQAGFILVGVVAVSREGLASSMFYLAAYGFAVLGSFAVITLVRDPAGEATHLSKWAGLGRKSPLVAGSFAVFMLAMAGIPLTSGFIAKFGVFSAAIGSDMAPLVVIAVIASVIAAFFYVRVIVLMFFSEPAPDGPSVVIPSSLTTIALAVGVAVTLVLGIIPQPVLDLVDRADVFIR